MGMTSSVKVEICPTVREDDGLAMSSRNRRLSDPHRALAGVIYQCLVSIKTKANEGNFALVQKECTDLLTAKGFVPEYIGLADAYTLEPAANYDPNKPQVILMAAWLGRVRLIDNMLL
jgi:pantoate--beta-alanine ligase